MKLADMEISPVGFGAWAIGGGGWAFAWGDQDDDASVAAIRHAVESGVTWVDTAAAYGLGHSEEVVAAALRDLPAADRPYVFTKGGLIRDGADRLGAPRRTGTEIRREVEGSLRRLEVERIDLYQMHWPADDGTVDDYWPVFADLVDEGKVRAIGLSNHSPAQLDAANRIRHVDSLQPPLNVLRRDAAGDVIPWCVEHGTGVIVYSPMASGLLTGAFSAERAARLGADDWRSRSADFTTDLDRNLAVVEALRPVAAKHEVSVGVVAIAWTLSVPGVTGAIVGARGPEQVDGWLPALSVRLDDDDLTTIADAVTRFVPDAGPVRP
jgi:aryl-alcohol dehydrogenase-like predicted oxidoreductase